MTIRPESGRVTVTAKELLVLLQQCDPEWEVVGKVPGGCVDIVWATDEDKDDDGNRVVMLGVDA